jgi:hypothetical protein
MSVVKQLYFQIVEENNMFQSFSGCAIIRLRLEYRKKNSYYNVDIKNGGTRSRFTMFGGGAIPHRVYLATQLPKHCKTRSRSPILVVHIVVYEFSPIF